jgi:hypothetical protein
MLGESVGGDDTDLFAAGQLGYYVLEKEEFCNGKFCMVHGR